MCVRERNYRKTQEGRRGRECVCERERERERSRQTCKK